MNIAVSFHRNREKNMIFNRIIPRKRAEYPLIISRRGRRLVLLFNTLIIKHGFITEKLETIFILPFFSPTQEFTYIAGYLLTTGGDVDPGVVVWSLCVYSHGWVGKCSEILAANISYCKIRG